ncbi:tripartite tricarboxylate transporter substrate-binding protein [Paracoccus sp. PS-1]|uniref:Bug family tripartite tricarboxylate transporter substrate binding protein n=1 Tax=unclassified Paracoccus (in: a-proteobacteria) TaxID=2688777 RepID=UPI00048A9BE3|nr:MULTISPECIES: tripartite tricarboxylate transporter substrate-binding protein [unclassified Paracoccus (in: a-proteobacteria)]MDQ7262645.1 tripartite tricarboxylate transporter substrate-binding protein [Paracoccus sp. PS1]
MTRITRRAFAVLMAGALSVASLAPAQADALLPSLELLAPSSPGSGYDQLARAVQGVLQARGTVPAVEVTNVAGGGGTVGLAQFVTSRPRKPSALIVGFALVGGVLSTKSAVTLEDVTPIARLMGDVDAIVVPAKSDIKTLDDLIAKLKSDPGAVSWAGGSIGGVDHITAGLFAKTVGVDPTAINYVVHAGGGEVLASVLGGHATVGISGYEEFRAQVENGDLRALAVSGEERIDGVDVPTFKEAGVDLAVQNWRGIVANPKAKDADREALKAAIDDMVKSPEWAEALKTRGWIDSYQPAEEFDAFLQSETDRIGQALKDAGVL